MMSFVAINALGQYSADIKANNGGICSQTEAVKMGIARAPFNMILELKLPK